MKNEMIHEAHGETVRLIARAVPCEVYSRVTGFYRPVSQFNAGKREEFRERRLFSVGTIAKKL